MGLLMKGLSRARNESSQISSPWRAGERTNTPTKTSNKHRAQVGSSQRARLRQTSFMLDLTLNATASAGVVCMSGVGGGLPRKQNSVLPTPKGRCS